MSVNQHNLTLYPFMDCFPEPDPVLASNPKLKTKGRAPDFPTGTPWKDIVTEITTEEAKDENLKLVHFADVRNSQRSRKLAILMEVESRNTNEFKHYALKLFSFSVLKRGIFHDFEIHFNLTNKDGEIDALIGFLQDVQDKKLAAFATRRVVINNMHPAYAFTQGFFKIGIENMLEESEGFREALKELGQAGELDEFVESDAWALAPAELATMLREVHGDNREEFVAALGKANLTPAELNILTGRAASLERFKQMLGENRKEPEWQKFLEANSWIIG